MEDRITSANRLEDQIIRILDGYRKNVYTHIEEQMWKAFEEIGTCIEQYCRTPFEEGEEDKSTLKAREYMQVMSRRSIDGLSFATIQDICKVISSGGTFPGKAKKKRATYLIEFLKARTLTFEATRIKYPNYLKTWTSEEDATLEKMWCEGMSTKQIAQEFGRNPGAINARIQKLELEEKYG